MLLKKRKWLTLLMACVCGVSILAGCGNTAQPSESTGTNQTDAASQEGDSTNSDNGSEIKVVMARSIDSSTLDPAMASKNQDIWMMNFALEGLVRSSEDGKEIEPAVADKWEISDDSLTYTFHLRDGVKFSTGEEVTPEDCVYSINRSKNMEGSPWSGMLSVIADVKAEGEDSVVITVSQPTPALLSLLAMFPCSIMPQSYCEEVGDEGIANSPVGTGPFILESWEKNNRMVFKKNPYYWQEGLPKIDEFDMNVVSDDNTRMMQLKSGQIDMAEPPLSQMAELQNTSGIVVDEFASTSVDYIILNCQNEKLSDPRVRQALELATDKEAIIKAVSFGYGTPADSFISPSAPHYNTNLPEVTRDVEKAKELMKEAGYENGMDLTVQIGSGSTSSLQEATLLKQQWSDIGVNLNIEQIDSATASANWSALNYEVYFSYLTSDMTDTSELAELWCVYDSTQCWGSGWNDDRQKEAEELVQKAATEMDEEKRMEYYCQMQEIVAEEVPNIPLYNSSFYIAHTDKISNLVQTPLGNYRFETLTKAQ
ncbi:MAG TPA: ABC transporter substrate-binding protein [Candidatus Scybalocola faecipullorum]|nr:ABC transporter substrate-binding protein [Candidatus Scybalocola faecipullorum]